MVLNTTNAEALAEIMGETNSDNWKPGTAVEIYVDPEVRFAGKKQGGLRLRTPDDPF